MVLMWFYIEHLRAWNIENKFVSNGVGDMNRPNECER